MRLLVLLAVLHLTLVPCVRGDGWDWLAGSWSGGDGDGAYEEHWSRARHGQMLGSFRYFQNGEPVFVELMVIDLETHPVQMRLRHFSPQLEPWEGPDEAMQFSLQDASQDVARNSATWFRHHDGVQERLIYETISPDRLRIQLEKKSSSETKITTFTFRSTP